MDDNVLPYHVYGKCIRIMNIMFFCLWSIDYVLLGYCVHLKEQPVSCII